MNIVNMRVTDLIPYSKNPRKNKPAIDKVAESIKEFGFKVPIIIDKDNTIVAGHTRLEAAKKLQLDEVPCVIASDLTESQIKAFRLADNKVAEFAEWDADMLADELTDLYEIDFDMTPFGFDPQEDLSEIIEDDFDADKVLDEIIEPVTKRGDIWQLGGHRLMCGDSTAISDVDRLTDSNKIDMLFTDPPYNVAFNGRSGKFDVIKNDNLNDEDFNEFIDGFWEL